MRKEYTLNTSTFLSDFFDSLDNFMANFPSLYDLIDVQTDRRVYRNISENLDLIFFDCFGRVGLEVTTEYNSTVDIFRQRDIIISGYDESRASIDPDGHYYTKIAAYYFPIPTLYKGNLLVANYNTENDTFMLSVINDNVVTYNLYDYVVKRTNSILFGGVEKYLDFRQNFFYGGDFVCSVEHYYREYWWQNKIGEHTWGPWNHTYLGGGSYLLYDSSMTDIQFHAEPTPEGHTGTWDYPWVSDPYNNKGCCHGTHAPNSDRVNSLELILRIDVDNAPKREEYSLVVSTPEIPQVPLLKRRNIWAVTMEIEYYVHMVCSITRCTDPLPRYEPLICHDSIEQGHVTNTLNSISIIMPLWFMVMRDPFVLETYSAACRNNVINFVNMYNMDTNRIINGTFPEKESFEYNCFQMGTRRSMFGMRGYSGLAFRQESEDAPTPTPPTDLELLDIDAMESHKTGGQDILNISVDGKLGYGGNTLFDSMPTGSFILKHPYTDYSSITFTFCDDFGTVKDTVTWTKAQLDAAFSGTSPFNLLPPTTPITDFGIPGEWSIEPFSSGSTSTVFMCSYENCGLIGAKGNV